MKVGGCAPSADFWQGRRVLVTGHTGFKGGWLALTLRMLGADVVGFGLPAGQGPSFYRAAGVGKEIEERFGDVRDAAVVRRTLVEVRPQTVFHLAAQPLVLQGYERPHETFAVNVLGVVNVLDAAALAGAEAVVVVTSDKCYRPRKDRPHREDDPLGGHDPYAASKAAAELAVEGYRAVFRTRGGPRLATARAGNVIGGGDFTETRLVPDLILAAHQGRTVQLRRPEAVRPWQHVLCPVLGYILLAERLAESEAFEGGWNFGPRRSEAAAVGEIVDLVQQLLPSPVAVEVSPVDEPEDGYLALDSGKAEALLGWQAPLRLREGLKLTVEWYRDYFAGLEMSSKTAEQIEEVVATGGGDHTAQGFGPPLPAAG